MKISLLKQRLIQYHQNKGCGKRSQNIPDHDEVIWLEAYIKILSNDQNISEDSNILFEDFKQFVEQNNTKKGLFSPNYLNSGNLSAALFREWQSVDAQAISLMITHANIKYNIPDLTHIDASKLDLGLQKELAHLAMCSPPDLNSDKADYIKLLSEGKSSSSFSALPKYLQDNITLWEIFSRRNYNDNNFKLKETLNYHNGTLSILGQQLLFRIKLYTKAQLESPHMQSLCIEMGKVFINFITHRSKEIPIDLLNVLKLQIERLICGHPAASSLFGRAIPKVSYEFVTDYIILKITQNLIEPFAVLLQTAEEINPTGIADTLKYLMN